LGSSPDDYTLSGDHTQLSSGTLTLDADSPGNDVLHIAGLSSLDGTFVLNALNGYTPGPFTQLSLIDFAGGLSGTFASLVLPAAGGSWLVSYGDPYAPAWFSLRVEDPIMP